MSSCVPSLPPFLYKYLLISPQFNSHFQTQYIPIYHLFLICNQKMVADRYRRTVSFPHPNPDRPSKPAKSYHVRSSSLPCVRSQPLIPQLIDEIAELRSWEHSRPDLIPCDAATSHSAWLLAGLSRLKSVLDSLDDVLQMPQTHDALSQRAGFVEKLLENFLQFVDAFGIFQTSVLALKQELSAAQMAARRRDGSNLALHVKSQKRIAKEMAKLVAAVRSIECPAASIVGADDEIACAIRGVHEVTGAVSAAVFDGAMRALGPARRRSVSWSAGSGWAGLGFYKKGKREGDVEEGAGDVMRKMKEMEECVRGMEGGSERVFRSLISTRVSLLNVLTHI